MFNHICHSISVGWEKFNRKESECIDYGIDKVVKASLPQQLESVVLNEYRTEARVMALWTINSALVTAAFCNPWISSWISVPLGIVSVIPTLYSLFVHCKSHMQTIKDELSFKDCSHHVAMLTSIVVLETIGLYLESDRSPETLGAISLLFANATACFAISGNSFILHEKRESIKLYEQIEHENNFLEKQNQILEQQVNQLDDFIKDKHDLYQLIIEHINQQPEMIELNPAVKSSARNELIKKRTDLSIELTRRQFYIDKRVSFIINNQKIYESFCEYVKNLNNSRMGSLKLV